MCHNKHFKTILDDIWVNYSTTYSIIELHIQSLYKTNDEGIGFYFILGPCDNHMGLYNKSMGPYYKCMGPYDMCMGRLGPFSSILMGPLAAQYQNLKIGYVLLS